MHEDVGFRTVLIYCSVTLMVFQPKYEMFSVCHVFQPEQKRITLLLNSLLVVCIVKIEIKLCFDI